MRNPKKSGEESPEFRYLIRIGTSAYVSIPKSVLSRLRLFRGSCVRIVVDGSKIILIPVGKYVGGEL